ncbi:hypothetical protein PHJA_000236700 [Phtheirospermum japonicum]|uniref:Uncharacterized protein n=1 Tax=Phtheirospermum japonicum TaxID=374723 RepID=A0A830B8C2_9LAMI|nr:hypothetical protein PHJA_000236700 [Phtheirospermum japonicum]
MCATTVQYLIHPKVSALAPNLHTLGGAVRFSLQKTEKMMTNEDVKLSMEDDKLIKAEGSGSNERVLRWNLRDRKSMRLSKAKQQQALTEKEDLPKLPSFSLELTADEIAEDLFAVTGKWPSRRTNKRDKNVHKQIDLIYPGGYLETITVDRYTVSRNNRKDETQSAVSNK